MTYYRKPGWPPPTKYNEDRVQAERQYKIRTMHRPPPEPVLDRTGKDDAFGGDAHVTWCNEEARLRKEVQDEARALLQAGIAASAEARSYDLSMQEREELDANLDTYLFAFIRASNALAAHWYSRPPADPDWLLGIDPTMPAERIAQWPACGTWEPPEAHTSMKARLASIAAAAAKAGKHP